MKKVIIAILIISLICGGVYAGLNTYKHEHIKSVPVYSVEEILTPSEYIYEDSLYGTISAERIQSVYLSQTQQIKEILVTEGQEVKKGDPLVSFDTTLTEIKLEKAKNKLAQEEYDLNKAKKELEKINKMVPHNTDDTYMDDYNEMPEPTPKPTPEPIPVEYEPQETNVLLRGEGTLENPYVYLWATDDAMSIESLVSMYLGGKPFYFNDLENDTTLAEEIVDSFETGTEIPEEKNTESISKSPIPAGSCVLSRVFVIQPSRYAEDGKTFSTRTVSCSFQIERDSHSLSSVFLIRPYEYVSASPLISFQLSSTYSV